MLSVLSFGLSWLVYALTFFASANVLPGFHSSYSQSTFKVAFNVGLANALLIKGVRLSRLPIPVVLVCLVCVGLDFLIIRSSSEAVMGFVVSGYRGPIWASVILGVVACVLEFIKDRFRADAQ